METSISGSNVGTAQTKILTLRESGFSRNPYIHTNFNNHPITFYWWAKTPSGRESVYWGAHTYYRTRYSGKLRRSASGHLEQVNVPTRYYGMSTLELYDDASRNAFASLQRLPRGYEWQGPFVYCNIEPPTQEGDTFAFKTPDKSDGIPLTYQMLVPNTGENLTALAKKILGESAVPA